MDSHLDELLDQLGPRQPFRVPGNLGLGADWLGGVGHAREVAVGG